MMKYVSWVFVLTLVLITLAKTPDSSKIIISKDTVLQNDLEIPSGSILIINSGVRVRLDGYRSIIVKGLLIAEGTDKQPIVFTSTDKSNLTSARPLWNGIEIRGKDAHGQFKHCVFEGAFRNLAWESSPVFDSCEFVNNHYGIYCTKKAVPHIKNCHFHLNTYAIASDYASPIIAGNIIATNVIGVLLQISSNALLGRNIFSGNQINIKSEDALGGNKSSLSAQQLWDVMQQLF